VPCTPTVMKRKFVQTGRRKSVEEMGRWGDEGDKGAGEEKTNDQ